MVANKKVTFGARPAAKPTANDWVGDKAASEPIKRLTLDIPAALHGRIKSVCALNGTKMIDEIRALLEAKYPPEEK